MGTKALRSSSAKRQFWQTHIAAWQGSGMSQRLYCKQHDLAVQTFGYWYRKLGRQSENKPRFYPIALSSAAPSAPVQQASADLELNVCGSRFSVKVGRDFDAETLSKLILSLEAMPCSDQARM